jgi:hypothetical protein
MFDMLVNQGTVAHATVRERFLLALVVLVISVILFAALYFGVQTAA